MCYTYDDSIRIRNHAWRTARKQHRCSECGEKIQPGERYEYAAGIDDGSWVSWHICGDCNTIAAYLYAIERSEGCEEWESRPPLGTGDLRSGDMADRGLILDDEWADDEWDDAIRLGQNRPHCVVRWAHIDAARAGKLEGAPFVAEVARRLRLYPVSVE